MKNIGADLAAQIVEKFASPEVRDLISRIKAASDDDTGTFRVVGTTENLDRYQEVIKLDGWDTERYMLNPVILWGHDHSRLIGMTTSIEVVDGKMIFNGKFAPTEEGQEKRRLYDLGFLRATSVGFIEKEREGNLITKAELLELSFVSVPANPYALSLAFERGLNEQELITKGIMFVEREAPETEAENEPVSAEESPDAAEAGEDSESPVDEPTEAQERSFSTKQIAPVLETARALVVALEALGTKSEEPEGDEAVAEDEEQRSYREFSEKRRTLQAAATVLGEVLAETRLVKDARKAA